MQNSFNHGIDGELPEIAIEIGSDGKTVLLVTRNISRGGNGEIKSNIGLTCLEHMAVAYGVSKPETIPGSEFITKTAIAQVMRIDG